LTAVCLVVEVTALNQGNDKGFGKFFLFGQKNTSFQEDYITEKILRGDRNGAFGKRVSLRGTNVTRYGFLQKYFQRLWIL